MNGQKKSLAGRYADMLDMLHPDSIRHPRMGMQERAAQFMPFAALTGYDGAISETARLTDDRIELSEDEQRELNEKLGWLAENIRAHPTVIISYFRPDIRKDGGAYCTLDGELKRIDIVQGTLQVEQTTLLFANIMDIIIRQ